MATNGWQTIDSTEEVELPRPSIHPSTAEPVPMSDLDDVVTAYPIGSSRSSDRLTDLETAWPIDSQTGQDTPRGQVSLNLDNAGLTEANLGLTSAEQLDLLQLARSTRRNVFFEMFMAIIMIPLFELSGWTFFYLVIPAIGFVAARWYLKRLIHMCVGLNAASTFLWAMAPFSMAHIRATHFGALLLLAIFLALKLYLTSLFAKLYWLVRYISARDLEVLANKHLRGIVSAR